jgi:lipopolysaccharide/colanic/teichoic acid biosynthesis glycosyltransferase
MTPNSTSSSPSRPTGTSGKTTSGKASPPRVATKDAAFATAPHDEQTGDSELRHQRLARLAKRLFDFSGAFAGLVVLGPLMAVIALLVRVFLGSPVLFEQLRPGQRERLFAFFKFRTMRDACDEQGRPLPDAQRLTPFGAWLRRTSLDELPQLFNVLQGDLSLVGPRPLLTEYLGLYSPEQARRHDVLPGITGWAQVNGRNSLSWERKFELDVWYVDHWSLALDLTILWLTIKTVWRRTGISHQGEVTMPKFTGSRRLP